MERPRARRQEVVAAIVVHLPDDVEGMQRIPDALRTLSPEDSECKIDGNWDPVPAGDEHEGCHSLYGAALSERQLTQRPGVVPLLDEQVV